MIKKENLILLSLITITVGIFLSRALMSIGNALLLLSALYKLDKNELRNIKKCFPLIALTSIIIWQTISIINTENTKEGTRILFLKLPYIIIPLALCLNKNFIKDKIIKITFHIFVLLAFLSSTITIINFLLNYEEILPRIKHSKSIPIIPEMEHIYFSTLIALAIIMSFCFYKNYKKWGFNFIKPKIYLIISILLTINLFLSTSRTGIIAFILAVITQGTIEAIRNKKYKLIFILISGITLLGIIIYNLPPVKLRIENTKKDIRKFLNNEDIADWSISRRLAAIYVSGLVIKEHPILGIGIGDTKTEFYEYYKYAPFKFYKPTYITPHNQFLELAVASGIIPAIILIILLLFWYKKLNTFGKFLLLIIFFALQVELMLERQRGINFILTIIMLLYVYNTKNKK